MKRVSKKQEAKVNKALHRFGAQSIENLALIASSEDTPQKLRADIWKWFAEMEFGKPTSKQSTEDASNEDEEIRLEGDLEVWSR